MKLAIFGTGYVGLVTGACLAGAGNQVTCVDIDDKKIADLKKGVSPIYEPGLEDLLKSNFKKGRLVFSTNSEEAVAENDLIFITVGTPSGKNEEVDLEAVFQVAGQIGKYMQNEKIIVQKSTVPPGTGKKIETIINQELKERKKNIKANVVSNPEFLKEGDAVNDFKKPDRVIIGSNDEKSKKILQDIYASFMLKEKRIIFMNRESAELVKYACNVFLANKISFINLLARLAENTEADIKEVRQGMASDPRIGNEFLFSGLGFGGSCFPKDVAAFKIVLKQAGLSPSLVENIQTINSEQIDWFWQKIENRLKNIKEKTIGIWGAAFKANTDDIRESPAIKIMERILEKGGTIKIFDPEAMKNLFTTFL